MGMMRMRMRMETKRMAMRTRMGMKRMKISKQDFLCLFVQIFLHSFIQFFFSILENEELFVCSLYFFFFTVSNELYFFSYLICLNHLFLRKVLKISIWMFFCLLL